MDIVEESEGYHLREAVVPYTVHFRAEKSDIGPKNSYFREIDTE
jgi:hypothetical protein